MKCAKIVWIQLERIMFTAFDPFCHLFLLESYKMTGNRQDAEELAKLSLGVVIFVLWQKESSRVKSETEMHMVWQCQVMSTAIPSISISHRKIKKSGFRFSLFPCKNFWHWSHGHYFHDTHWVDVIHTFSLQCKTHPRNSN